MRELLPWLALIFQRPRRLLAGAGLILLTLLSGIALLAVSGWFITETALVGLLLAAGVQASVNLYVPGGAIRFFAVSRTVARYLERVYNHDTVLRLLTDIRVALFRRLARTGPTARYRMSSAQWLSRLTTDVDALDTLYLRLIAPAALALVVSLLVALLAWILIDGRAALLVAVCCLAAFVLATVGVHRRCHAMAATQSEQLEQLRTGVIEHLDGFSELTASGQLHPQATALLEEAGRINQHQARVESRVGWHQAGTQLLINLSAVLVLWLGIEVMAAGRISGPVLVLMPIAILGLVEVYAMLPDAFGKLGGTQASASRLTQDTRPAAPEDTPEAVSPPQGHALVARDLSVRHPGATPIITHLDLDLENGERLGIVGPSGCGKSTLADTLAGLLAPARGTLATRPCAYLTQRTVLFDDTLRANLRLGSPGATDEQLWQVLELVGLGDRFAREPEQLDTWLGNTGSRLSGGEARRVALARVLLCSAPLVILDEPFTGVDSDTRERIVKRLDRWLEGRAVIALAHGPDALPGTDRVIHL